MNEIMSTEEMEHVQQDRDISAIMRRRDAEYQQKVDDEVKAEAAKYAAHMRRVRDLFHKAAHATLVLTGVGIQLSVTMVLASNVWGLAGSVLGTLAVGYLSSQLHQMSKKGASK